MDRGVIVVEDKIAAERVSSILSSGRLSASSSMYIDVRYSNLIKSD